jgi:hypothetical protein
MAPRLKSSVCAVDALLKRRFAVANGHANGQEDPTEHTASLKFRCR